jgi:acetolactate synthase-1/2/3 large subunit
MKLSDYVFSFLAEKGIDTFFYLPGGGCMHLLDSMAKNKNIKSISLLHEQAVAVACESYANTTGKMGAALVTTGPGATNTITGMLAAYLDSSPCFFISGQVKTADLKSRFGVRSHGSQEADIVTIVSTITKYAVMVTDKNKIRYHLEHAWHEAMSGRRGPVLLDIPLDIQGAQIEIETLESYTPPPQNKPAFDSASVINILNKAQRPLLIVGNGLNACKSDFYSLMNYLSIPVIPSWKAMDYIANDHPLYTGRVGGMGDRAGNIAMQNADLIISLGCRLDFSITGFDRSQWATNAKKIVVDIDDAEISKLESAGDLFPVIADTSDVIAELLIHKDKIRIQDLSSWKEKIAHWKNKYPVISHDKYTNAQGGLTTYAIVDTLCRYLPNDAHVAPCSSGTTAEIFFQAFTVKQGQTVRSNHGLGSMGFEIPNAIGMCVAAGNKNTVCIAGDGGMQLNIQELSVIRGRNLPVKIFVINNHGYASIRNMQNNHFAGHHAGCDVASGLFLPELRKLSAAYEIPYFRIQNEAELDDAVQSVLRENGPALCEVIVDGECLVTPRSATQIMSDGSMRSSPLENQFPFLSEEEVEYNNVYNTTKNC